MTKLLATFVNQEIDRIIARAASQFENLLPDDVHDMRLRLEESQSLAQVPWDIKNIARRSDRYRLYLAVFTASKRDARFDVSAS